jgi:hypothetical protein
LRSSQVSHHTLAIASHLLLELNAWLSVLWKIDINIACLCLFKKLTNSIITLSVPFALSSKFLSSPLM